MPSKKIYETIRSLVLDKMKNLPTDLTYHSIEHTLDVEKQAERIALSEKVSSKEELFLLKVACLYHDIGFLTIYIGHEKEGCKLVKEELPGLGFTQQQVNIICGLIMATRIPQTPLTTLEKIICDADLDYLGRNDYPAISHNLFLELKARNMINTENEWNKIQSAFLKKHKYFTNTCTQLREKKKLKHLDMIESGLLLK
jgi:HD superfamily phosphodiesterase